ncbi:MAG TPA: MaoC family dehydratase [Candidatus Dormibacteraeota bacterium]|nr:MaoC family dehydratase [Candidatus Dormibacteraeota bacterium]
MAAIVVESAHSLKDFVGREIPPTDWLTLTQERIHKFAEATSDPQWIHLDRDRAGHESPYGTTIAHGFLTLSLLSYFMKQALEIRASLRMAVNYGLNRVRFPSPVLADSRIRARFTVLSVKDLADSLETTFSVAIEREGSDKPCCVAEWIVRYYHKAG